MNLFSITISFATFCAYVKAQDADHCTLSCLGVRRNFAIQKSFQLEFGTEPYLDESFNVGYFSDHSAQGVAYVDGSTIGVDYQPMCYTPVFPGGLICANPYEGDDGKYKCDGLDNCENDYGPQSEGTDDSTVESTNFIRDWVFYLYAEQTGTYSWDFEECDDYCALWVGAGVAFECESIDSSAATSSQPNAHGTGQSMAHSMFLDGGYYYPVRYLYVNSKDEGHFTPTITGPDGNIISSDNAIFVHVPDNCDVPETTTTEEPETTTTEEPEITTTEEPEITTTEEPEITTTEGPELTTTEVEVLSSTLVSETTPSTIQISSTPDTEPSTTLTDYPVESSGVTNVPESTITEEGGPSSIITSGPSLDTKAPQTSGNTNNTDNVSSTSGENGSGGEMPNQTVTDVSTPSIGISTIVTNDSSLGRSTANVDSSQNTTTPTLSSSRTADITSFTLSPDFLITTAWETITSLHTRTTTITSCSEDACATVTSTIIEPTTVTRTICDGACQTKKEQEAAKTITEVVCDDACQSRKATETASENGVRTITVGDVVATVTFNDDDNGVKTVTIDDLTTTVTRKIADNAAKTVTVESIEASKAAAATDDNVDGNAGSNTGGSTDGDTDSNVEGSDNENDTAAAVGQASSTLAAQASNPERTTVAIEQANEAMRGIVAYGVAVVGVVALLL